MRRSHALLLATVPAVVGLLLGYRLLPVRGLFTAHAGQANQQSGVQTRTNQEAVVSGNTAFAIDLYQQLREQPGNLFLSPFSISTALAMTIKRGIAQDQRLFLADHPFLVIIRDRTTGSLLFLRRVVKP